MNRDNTGKYNSDSQGHTHGYDFKGGWDIDTSERTQTSSDGGHIPGRYQWEETVNVSDDEDTSDNSSDTSDDD